MASADVRNSVPPAPCTRKRTCASVWPTFGTNASGSRPKLGAPGRGGGRAGCEQALTPPLRRRPPPVATGEGEACSPLLSQPAHDHGITEQPSVRYLYR